MNTHEACLDRFYDLLARLEKVNGGKRQLARCHGQMGWPKRGVYFFFEDGEVRSDGTTPRVVRVGTHGLRKSSATLWSRLSQHRGTVGGSMPGGGNHRGSIFRLHVGTALLASGHWSDSIRHSWAVGSNAPSDVRRGEYPLELAVSQHIGAMPFLWLEVEINLLIHRLGRMRSFLAPGPFSLGEDHLGAIFFLDKFSLHNRCYVFFL